jgi:hypothetical protein
MKDVTSPQSKAAVKQWIYYGLVLVVVFIIAMVLIKVFKAAKAGSTAAGDLAGALIIQQQNRSQRSASKCLPCCGCRLPGGLLD